MVSVQLYTSHSLFAVSHRIYVAPSFNEIRHACLICAIFDVSCTKQFLVLCFCCVLHLGLTCVSYRRLLFPDNAGTSSTWPRSLFSRTCALRMFSPPPRCCTHCSLPKPKATITSQRRDSQCPLLELRSTTLHGMRRLFLRTIFARACRRCFRWGPAG